MGSQKDHADVVVAAPLVGGIDQAVEEFLAGAAGDEMQDHFGVHGGLEDRPVAHESVAQLAGIGEVAIVRHSKSAAGEVCDDGNNEDGDGCSANCRSDDTCGNGIWDEAAGEVCEDGNHDEGDGCSAGCSFGGP